MVKLSSAENEIFQVDRDIAIHSNLLKTMLEVVEDSDDAIPLTEVSAKTLKKMLEFGEQYREEIVKPEEEVEKFSLNEWDKNFFNIDIDDLIDLVKAANYLDTKLLFKKTCQSIADIIKTKSREEICKIFDLEEEVFDFDEKKEEKKDEDKMDEGQN